MDNENIDDIKKLLKSSINPSLSTIDQSLYSNLLKLLDKDKFSDVFKKNLVWVNSFDINDCVYINEFVSYILKKNNISQSGPKLYPELLDKVTFNDLGFNQIANFSYLYQYLISELYNEIIILNSSAVFFETLERKYFTHYFLTKFYIYIVKNPATIYLQRKINNPKDDINQNLHGLTLSDTNYINTHTFGNKRIEENTHNWSTNVSSWTNSNVRSTFKGLIIKYERLVEDPQQVLAELVAHMIQSGLEIKLNYSEINEFIDSNSLSKQNFNNLELSNKELKILKRDNFKVAKNFDYFN